MKKTIVMAMMTAAVVSGLSGCTTSAGIPDTIKVESAYSEANQVMVSGTESVQVTPDMTELIFSIRTQKPTPQECQQENSKNLDATIAKLKELGIQEESIQTSSYGLNPIYNWDSDTQEITGYEMQTRLTVSGVPVENAGTILSEGVQSGVNAIESVSYYCSNYDEQYQEALKLAVDMAHKKAQAMAEGSGRNLGLASHMEETSYNPSARYTDLYSGAGQSNSVTMETDAATKDMAVMPGLIEVEASVNVTYRLE